MDDYAVSLGIKVTGNNTDPDKLIDWFDDEVDLAVGDTKREAEVEKALANGYVPNNYRFLSNFYSKEPFTTSLHVGTLTWKPREFKTGEHAYQAAKAVAPSDFAKIADAESPGEAKRLGQQVALNSAWETVKFDVMREVLRAKFGPATESARLLMTTGDALLVEGTFWRDRVWGVDLKAAGTPGRNWLGTLLMARRAELYSFLDYSEATTESASE